MHNFLQTISRRLSRPLFARLLLTQLLFGALLCSTVNAQPAKPPAATTPAATPVPTPTPASTPKEKLGGVVGDRNITLNDRVPPEQMLSLQAGSETFPARYIADLSGLPRGAVIIMHASGQHPSWPFTVAALIDDLPLHGWSTLSIELPAPPQDATASTATPAIAPTTAPPTATAANPPSATPTPTPSNTTAATGVEPQAQARIAAAVKYFVDQKQTNVVLLGFGSGATRAAEAVRQMIANQPSHQPEPITTLILIAPANRVNGIDQDLPKILPSSELPTLDIILSSDPQAVADAEARRRAVLHQRKRVYRRLELPPIAATESAQHSLMVRRVRAWLQREPSPDASEKDEPKE